MTVHTPTSLREATARLAEDPGAHLLTGGTDLMVEVNFNHRRPETVVSLRRVKELNEWHLDSSAGRVFIGAGVPYADMERGELAAALPALAEAAHSQAMALSAIAQSATTLIEQFDHKIATLQRESAGLALVIARKLAGEALSRAPHAELEAFLVDCFHKLHREARLVVTVPAESADGLRDRLGDLVESSGFAGRVIIMADTGMRISDCRVEWADGGIEKNLDDVFAAMEEQLHRWALSPKAGG